MHIRKLAIERVCISTLLAVVLVVASTGLCSAAPPKKATPAASASALPTIPENTIPESNAKNTDSDHDADASANVAKPKPSPKRIRAQKSASSSVDQSKLATTNPAKKKLASTAAAASTAKAKPAADAPAADQDSENSVKRTVIYQGGTVTTTGEVYRGVPYGKEDGDQRAAADWMQGAESNLRTLEDPAHPVALSADQQSTRAQAKSYLQEAHEAVRDGDLNRALTLSKKAKLLSDSLLRR